MPNFARAKHVPKSTVDSTVFEWMAWLHEQFDGAIDGDIAVSTISNGVAVTMNGVIAAKSTYADAMGYVVTTVEALEGAEVSIKQVKTGYDDRGNLTINVGLSIVFPQKTTNNRGR